MNPPEKIFIVDECCHCPHHSLHRAIGIKDVIICEKLHAVIDIYTIPKECPLPDSPVWHDAVKDPPIEEGEYLCRVTISFGTEYRIVWYSASGGWDGITPDCWQPLPDKPEWEAVNPCKWCGQLPTKRIRYKSEKYDYTCLNQECHRSNGIALDFSTWQESNLIPEPPKEGE